MIAEDLSIFFKDHGVQAAWTPTAGGVQQTALVLFDEPDELVLGDALVVSNICSITYALGLLTGLDEGETLTITLGSGAVLNCRVRERPRQTEDGNLMNALISKG